MISVVEFLHRWQDLSGAIVGGLLGVIGALIVARGVLNRERRSASRMLQSDLLNVTGMIYGLTYRRTVTLETVGATKLAKDLSFFQHHLSPLFEVHLAVMIGVDTQLAGLLVGFYATYSAVEKHAHTFMHSGIGTEDYNRAERELPRALKLADDYAQATLYLLPIHETGALRRTAMRLRRRFIPMQSEKIGKALVKQLSEPSPETPGAPGEPGAPKVPTGE